jgi:cholesterol transport system auxiliary component
MKRITLLGISISLLGLVACSPVKIPVTNQYQLNAYSTKQMSAHARNISIWVTPPEAAAGYQTEQMIYVKKPYELAAFVKNSWTNAPGEMLYPLIVQSLQRTGFFHAVISSTYSLGADYRLDTQVLSLQQNFLKKPSVLEFSAKVVLTRIRDNKVLASRIITQHIPCSMDTPYGGVIAANVATRQFTAVLSDFVIAHIKP